MSNGAQLDDYLSAADHAARAAAAVLEMLCQRRSAASRTRVIWSPSGTNIANA